MEVLDKGFVELIDHMGDDNRVVSAARVSYLGKSKGEVADAKLIKYLIENEHWSPFEHVVFQFMVKAPIFVARQWMRHWSWSYSEVSRRYTSEEIEFHFPEVLRAQSPDNKQMSAGEIEDSERLIMLMKANTEGCLATYEYLLNKGVSREMAREVLPPNLYTKYYGTVSLRDLMHFLNLRNHPHAQEEIRVYAQAIETLIEPYVPVTMKIWKELKERV